MLLFLLVCMVCCLHRVCGSSLDVSYNHIVADAFQLGASSCCTVLENIWERLARLQLYVVIYSLNN